MRGRSCAVPLRVPGRALLSTSTFWKAEALVEANPGKRVACLGLAFKANIDDFRESPARLVAATLARKFGERIEVVEPYASELPREFEGTGTTGTALVLTSIAPQLLLGLVS